MALVSSTGFRFCGAIKHNAALIANKRQVLAMASSSGRIVDSHLHVWASKKEAQDFPYFPGQEPTIDGSIQLLLDKLCEANVAGALIVQPINHKFDHSYVTSVLQSHPEKFVGCCLGNPEQDGRGLAELERLVEHDGYRAVRFNPYLWPSGEKMTNEVGKRMFAKAGQLGIPVGFMCFKGLSLHIEEIETLCSLYPSTTVLIDHFGFCKPAVTEEETATWNSLLGLARYPQVYVKVSAFFRVSRESYPYKDTWTMLRRLLDVYGPRRLMWGSDFPFVNQECGYANAVGILHAARDHGTVSRDELEWLLGKTARQVFGGVWAASS
ncbi:uncharacterized protein LOC9650966 [Selaginella moellendorffii]|nr:uncharacterized protein LOC9650966 [Selaginella moellendorffii]|eukprot:XP_002968753.2 uncharacterized protein LOC9650966 [Selaginella moellendorffii]